jgi:DNA-binding NarL/FixJ family response regulator
MQYGALVSVLQERDFAGGTVRNHKYRIFPKLGVTSRTELAAVVGAPAGPV